MTGGVRNDGAEREFTVAEFQNGDLRVSWEYIGEGWYGDFDPSDPTDEPLLRFYCYRSTASGDWVEDVSFCTKLSVHSDVLDLRRLTYNEMFPALRQPDYRRFLEHISHAEVAA